MDNHISGGFFFSAVVMGQQINITLPREVQPRLDALPKRDSAFAGRSDELTEAVEGLQRFRLVTIVGMPGIGKSRLAIEAAWRAWKDEGLFRGGVLMIELHSYDHRNRLSTAQALGELLRDLAISDDHIKPIRDNEQELTKLYRSVLAAYAEQGQRLLIVVDDTSDEEQANPLLPSDDYHAALVTSRHKLALGEARMELGSLDPDAAVEVLHRVLGAGDTRVDGDRAAAERIADLCSHLPLALRISAALLAVLPVPLNSFAAQLADERVRLDRLEHSETMAVRAAFNLSYQRLRPEHARLFRLLALNPGPDLCTEAADHLERPFVIPTIAPVNRGLEALARAHLIEIPRWGRWRFHDLVRLYAEERAAVDGGGEIAEAEHRLYTYYLETAAAAALNLNDLVALSNDGPLSRFVGNTSDGVRWLDEEYANLLATTIRVQDAGYARLAVMLPVALGGYLRLRRVLPQWTVLLRNAVAAGESLGEAELTGIVLDLLGLALQDEGRLDDAAAAARRAAKYFHKAGEEFRENVALSHLGRALARQGRHMEAVKILRRTVDKMEGLGGRMTSRAHALKDLGEALLQLRRFEEAAKYSEEAAACFWMPLHDEISEAEALLCQGRALLELGDPVALVHLDRASRHFRKHDRLAGLASALNAIGCALWSGGSGDEAVRFLREAADFAEKATDDRLRSEVIDNLYLAYTILGRADDAARLASAHHPRTLPPLPGNAPPYTPGEGDGRSWWRRLRGSTGRS
ncbi:tetratricopeptide repeat protein [Streptomyces sp. NPDC102395]|uniref:tetratricopeptide repeat protein n=1 Tax=Streptomyces sp. NPDC102395 TaxID=3366168 RepID=UPI003805DA2B